MALKLSDILAGGVKFGSSDIHLSEGYPPYLRVHGLLRPVQAPALDNDTLKSYIQDMMPQRDKYIADMENKGGVDFAYQISESERYRVAAYQERGRLKIVMRTIPTDIPTLEEMELPDTLKKLAVLPRGMVLVTGATGSGKSTSLAAMIRYSNSSEPRCIITIEDPIEFVHDNIKSIVTQREVGEDVSDFTTGLVQALRQDPDTVLIGELRDTETMRVAFQAADTGHLVFSTLHTTNAVQTVERVIATFPEEERDMIREQIATNLKGAIAQRLVRRVGNKGRVAAMEIMVVDTTVQKLIAENRIRDIPGVISGREEGMRLFDQSLSDLVREGKVAQDEAEKNCDDLFAFRRFVKGVQSTGEGGGIIAGF